MRTGLSGPWSTAARLWPTDGTALVRLDRRAGSAAGGVGVVVDVGLPEVLFPGVFVRLVVVFHGWMVMLVGMGGRHVFPVGAVPEVVHHVGVLVGVNDGLMGVLHGLLLVTLSCVRDLLIGSVYATRPLPPGTTVTFGRV